MKKAVVLLAVLSVLLCVSVVLAQDTSGETLPEATDVTADACHTGLTDSTPRYAIVSAFGRELQLHVDKADIEAVYTIGGRNFYVGTLKGKAVVMFNSGGSLVNPAITMQDACYNFNLSGVLFSGIAGGMDESIHIGDVVIPALWKEYWHALLARENPDGTYQIPDWFPGDPEVHFDYVFPMPPSLTRVDAGPDQNERGDWYYASEAYLELASDAVSGLTLLDCTPEGVCLSEAPTIVVGGAGVSGDTYMDNAEVRKWVNNWTGALVLDMESASLAHWATTRNMPFIIFRSASDLAGGGEAENEIGTFFALAADNGASVLQAVLAAFPAP